MVFWFKSPPSQEERFESLLLALFGKDEDKPPPVDQKLDPSLFFDPPFIVKAGDVRSDVACCLPNELLDLIFRKLSWDTTKSFSLVCKCWAQISRSHAWFSELTLALDNVASICHFHSLVAVKLSTVSPTRFVLKCTDSDHTHMKHGELRILNPNAVAHYLPNVRRLSVRESISPTMVHAVHAFRNTITFLSFDINFFPSVLAFVQVISSFSVLEVLRIACSQRVMSYFTSALPLRIQWPPVPQRLRQLSFEANTYTIMQSFAEWFTRSSLPSTVSRLAFHDAHTLLALAHFWRLLFCFSDSLEDLSLAIADGIHLERPDFGAAMFAATTTFFKSTGKQFHRLRELRINEYHLTNQLMDLALEIESTRRESLSTRLGSIFNSLSAPHLQRVVISLLPVHNAMNWTSLDDALASQVLPLGCVQISAQRKTRTSDLHETQESYNSEPYWRTRLSKSSKKGLLRFDGQVN